MGFRNRIHSTTVAAPNVLRVWRFWYDLTAVLIWRIRKFYLD
jgi:hypothetical protein